MVEDIDTVHKDLLDGEKVINVQINSESQFKILSNNERVDMTPLEEYTDYPMVIRGRFDESGIFRPYECIEEDYEFTNFRTFMDTLETIRDTIDFD